MNKNNINSILNNNNNYNNNNTNNRWSNRIYKWKIINKKNLMKMNYRWIQIKTNKNWFRKLQESNNKNIKIKFKKKIF